MNLKISRANVSDSRSLLAVQRVAFQREAALYNNWSLPALTQSIEELTAEFATKVILKAEIGSTIVGSIRGATIRKEVCEISRLVVAPDWQCNGIGTKLMIAIEEHFPAARCFALFTGSRSTGNIRLYQRLGYRITRTEQISPTVNLAYMEKYLTRTSTIAN